MSAILIDTHCWLWAINSPELLNRAAAELLVEPENAFLLSAVSALEIAIKWAGGKLDLPQPPEKLIASSLEMLPMKSLPVYQQHALRVGELPPHHRDPFDRLLIAQAQIERLPIMTADPLIAQYDVEIIWGGRGRAPRRSRLGRIDARRLHRPRASPER